MTFLKSNKMSRISFFLLAAVSGIIILCPLLDFQPLLSQGDHGQNLYAFQQTYKGFVPCKDYWWGYGPFSPYYYSIFFHLFGENIQSVLIGRVLLMFLSGLIFYGLLSFFAPSLLAVIASIWFWTFYPDFFYTYTHTGAAPLFMAITYFAFAYIKTGKKNNIIYGVFCAFILALIRLNMGICLLGGFLAAIFLTDFVNDRSLCWKNKSFYIVSAILVPLLLLIIYGLLIHGLPDYAVRQSLPYGNKFYYNLALLPTLRSYITQIVFNVTSTWHALFFSVIVILCTVRIFFLWASGHIDEKSRKTILLTIGTTLIFLFLVSHEYFLGSVSYRIIWIQPFHMLLLFLVIAFGTKSLHKNTRLVFYFAILLMAAQSIFIQHLDVRSLKIPRQYLSLHRAQIYTGNPPQWIQTVEQTTQYLNNTLRDEETFLALPYEPIYYFLTGKPSPAWHVLFTKAIRFTDKQEEEMINTLKNDNINTIVLSNRMNSPEPGIGILGQTHLIRLYQYITDHYKPVKTFGEWKAEPKWIEGHAIIILKRIQ